jgi:hypothetical protein
VFRRALRVVVGEAASSTDNGCSIWKFSRGCGTLGIFMPPLTNRTPSCNSIILPLKFPISLILGPFPIPAILSRMISLLLTILTVNRALILLSLFVDLVDIGILVRISFCATVGGVVGVGFAVLTVFRTVVGVSTAAVVALVGSIASSTVVSIAAVSTAAIAASATASVSSPHGDEGSRCGAVEGRLLGINNVLRCEVVKFCYMFSIFK